MQVSKYPPRFLEVAKIPELLRQSKGRNDAPYQMYEWQQEWCIEETEEVLKASSVLVCA